MILRTISCYLIKLRPFLLATVLAIITLSLSLFHTAADRAFKINQHRPIVNEGRKLTLTATGGNGQSSNSTRWESGSPEIAQIDPQSGEVVGVMQGYATITAYNNGESDSVFIVVTRVRKGSGTSVPGDAKVDPSGNVYISNPIQNTILKTDNTLNNPLELFAGKAKVAGMRDGERHSALFAGPTAISIDTSSHGGIYITDTLNHSIRKISFNNQVETLLGKGSPGLTKFADTRLAAFNEMLFNSPHGIATDQGGNLFIADTDNHAIYYVDIARQQVTLIAGEPGTSGNDDGTGRNARFNHPTAIAISNDYQILAVADANNNSVRLIAITRGSDNMLIGDVSTIGASSATPALNNSTDIDQFIFDQPTAVSFDALGNIIVIDRQGAQVILRSAKQAPQLIPLAQPEISFNQAINVVVRGNESFVLDSEENESEAIKVVTVGAPEIHNVSPAILNMDDDNEIIIKGRNFAPESQISFGAQLIEDATVVSATEIRLHAGKQTTPGSRTLSILTRGGVVQVELNVVAKPVELLAKGEITTIAGGSVFSGNGGQALQASISSPIKLVRDVNGNTFIASYTTGTIQRIDVATGVINIIAGGGISTKDNVLAITAKMTPTCMAIDRDGNIYIGESSNNSLRRIDFSTKKIATIAGGKGSNPFSGDGPAIGASLGGELQDIIIDRIGNIYIVADGRVLQIDANTGYLHNIVGNGGSGEFKDRVLAKNASLGKPIFLALDQNETLYISAYAQNHIYYLNRASGKLINYAGNDQNTVPPNAESYNGRSVLDVPLKRPDSMVFDEENNLIFQQQVGIFLVDAKTKRLKNIKIDIPNPEYIAGNTLAIDGNNNLFFNTGNAVYTINSQTGNSSLIAGGNGSNLHGDNCPAMIASVGGVGHLTVDQFNNIFFADAANGLVRKIDANTKNISTIVSLPLNLDRNNRNPQHRFIPYSLALSQEGELYIDDFSGYIYRLNQATGQLISIAGNGSNEPGMLDKNGHQKALNTPLFTPLDITFDKDNNLLIAGNGQVRKIDLKTGEIYKAVKHFFSTISPVSVTTDNAGSIYAVKGTSLIAQIDTQGNYKIIAGTGSLAVDGDGGPAAYASLGAVQSLAVNKKGELFFAAIQRYEGNVPLSMVRRINLQTGVIDTIIKSDGNYYGDGGPAANASIVGFIDITFDKDDNLLIFTADEGRYTGLRFIKLN